MQITVFKLNAVNTTPLLKDLYQHITPQYAADWKVIGTLLGLPSGELKAIEAGYPTNVKWCCNQMLEKWLEMDVTASWGKLLTIITSPAISCSGTDKGEYIYDFAYIRSVLYVCVLCVCVPVHAEAISHVKLSNQPTVMLFNTITRKF